MAIGGANILGPTITSVGEGFIVAVGVSVKKNKGKDEYCYWRELHSGSQFPSPWKGRDSYAK
jgi:hypothetical protein